MTDAAFLADPTPAEAADAVREADDRTVALYGACELAYDGRATSTLPAGRRHVLRKPDGTLLAHAATGHQPANWLAPGASLTVSVEDDELLLRGERDGETLDCRFTRIHHVSLLPLDDADAEVSGTEEDLRERVLADPDLVSEGFRPLATERDTAAGPVDVYGEDADGTRVVVELKRRRVGPDAASQLDRYVDALERDLHADADVRGVLVAPSVTDRARQLLAEAGHDFVPLTP
ncbi:endonuclease NucS [Salarchaeum japonicum]|uniref:endonuclease NucS n=1 Tax=Salarchaeum japonicum TaxID=555573 RepID=UPI003C77803B